MGSVLYKFLLIMQVILVIVVVVFFFFFWKGEVNQGFPKKPEPIVHISISFICKKIYFKVLAHVIVEAGNVKSVGKASRLETQVTFLCYSLR